MKVICEMIWKENKEEMLNKEYFSLKLANFKIPDSYFNSIPATLTSITTIYKEIISGGL